MSKLLTKEQIEQATYMYALKSLHGIGLKSVLEIAKVFPQLQEIPGISLRVLEENLPIPLAKKLHEGISREWKDLFLQAQRAIEQHLDKGISPLSITSQEYPALLKLIEDPPPLLYSKGDQTLLNHAITLAIIGTREATSRGLQTAHTVAYHAACHGCVIVSGLAKGTDTAAHVGAIEARGKTIAVLATPLDKIYPAENKELAERISLDAGVLVSECALGTATNKGTFVARDRIQSGLSLGVFPVQTDINGGTMHTVRFAREQKRPLFCSQPPKEEMGHEKNRGILYLIEQMEKENHIDRKKRTINLFPLNRPGIYDRLVERLQEQRLELLGGQQTGLSLQHTHITRQPLLPPSDSLFSVMSSIEAITLSSPPSSLSNRDSEDTSLSNNSTIDRHPTVAEVDTPSTIPHENEAISMSAASEERSESENLLVVPPPDKTQAQEGIPETERQAIAFTAHIVQQETGDGVEQSQEDVSLAKKSRKKSPSDTPPKKKSRRHTSESSKNEPIDPASEQREHTVTAQGTVDGVEQSQENGSPAKKSRKKSPSTSSPREKQTRQTRETQKDEQATSTDKQDEQNIAADSVASETAMILPEQTRKRSSGEKGKPRQVASISKRVPEVEQPEMPGLGSS